MEIINYLPIYEEEVKDLLVELQEYISKIDREKYNIMTDSFREESFKETIKEIQENGGKMLLAKDNDKIIGFIAGIIMPAEDTWDFKAPKGGKVTELIVSKNARSKGVGQSLLYAMEEYFRNEGCKRILLEVFEYNDLAKNFYNKNNYFIRVKDMMKKI